MKNLIPFVLVLSASISLCCSSKNEYGKKRFRSVSPYKEKMLLTDARIFDGYYKLHNEKETGLRQNLIVFYSDGKAGNFLDYPEAGFDFNPKKAEMGYYGSKNNRHFLKFKTEFPGGYKIDEAEIVFLDKDSLIVQTKKVSHECRLYLKIL